MKSQQVLDIAQLLIKPIMAERDEAIELLRGAQTHLLDGDNSIWRRELDAFLARYDASYTAQREVK